MANFSTLFPNLQLDLDYSGDGTTANATSSQISTWARGGDTSVIPLSKLPALTLGHTHTYTSTATTHAAALAAFRAAFNAAGTASGGITVAVGTVLNAGDILILTASGGIFESYLYTGDPVTADAGAGNAVAEADFIDITNAGDGVTQVIGGTNLNTTGNVTEGNVTVNLDASIAGITNINTTAATNLILGNAGATLNIDSSTFDVDATNANITSTGAATLAAGNNSVATLSAGTGAAAEVDITSQGTGVSAIDINSSGGIDIDSTGDISIETANGGFEVNAAGTNGTVSIGGSQATTITGGANLSLTAIASELRVAGTGITAGTDAAPAVLGVGADGRLQTVNVVTGGGALGYATVPDTAATTLTTAQLNGVIFIGSQSQAATITIPATTANGTYIKVINNSGRADTTLSSTNSFVGTADTTLVLNDTSANFELIFTAGGWAVLSS